MADPKAKTLQQRFGFMDTDLKTPKHNEVMLWLDNNMDEIVLRLVGGQRRWADSELAKLRQKADEVLHTELARRKQEARRAQEDATKPWGGMKQLQQATKAVEECDAWLRAGLGAPPLIPDPGIQRKTWEWPVATGQYVVGFVDLLVAFGYPGCLDLEYWHSGAGHLDIPPQWHCPLLRHRVCFEVKSAISSLGELIRQVQFYRQYISLSFVIVAPDARYSGPLLSQNIGFIQYPSDGKSPKIVLAPEDLLAHGDTEVR